MCVPQDGETEECGFAAQCLGCSGTKIMMSWPVERHLHDGRNSDIDP